MLCSRWHSCFPYELLAWVLPSSVLGRVSGDKEGAELLRSSGFLRLAHRGGAARGCSVWTTRGSSIHRDPKADPKHPGPAVKPRRGHVSHCPSPLGNESPDPELPFVPVPTASSQSVSLFPSVSLCPVPCPPIRGPAEVPSYMNFQGLLAPRPPQRAWGSLRVAGYLFSLPIFIYFPPLHCHFWPWVKGNTCRWELTSMAAWRWRVRGLQASRTGLLLPWVCELTPWETGL